MSANAGPDFVPTPMQRELADAARDFLRRTVEVSPAEPGRLSDGDLWKRIGTELGWTALALPQRHGGLGGSLADLAVVLEEAGRVLLGVPLADNATCATGIADLVPGTPHEPLLRRLGSGDAVAALAFDSSVRGERTGDGRVLHGAVSGVLHGDHADVLLLWADVDGVPTLLLLTGENLDLVRRRRMESADRTRPLGHLELDGVEVPEVAVLAAGQQAAEVHAFLRAFRAVALAAESVGGADEALRMAVDYARERKQFDRPIGSFQAIKHKLADVLVLVEQARTMVRCAATWPSEDADGFVHHAAVAKAHADRAFRHASGECIQTHGGMGFTWEHPAHLYYKRAALNAQLVWPATACREWLRHELFG